MKRLIQTILRIAPVTAIVLSIVELLLSNQTAGSGKAVRAVDIRIDTIRTKNEQLAQMVASASSLLTIESKAKDLGLTNAKQSQYLTVIPEQLPVAINTNH